MAAIGYLSDGIYSDSGYFGPLRSATMGLRLLTGIMLGFGFYILNQLFGPLSLVYATFPAALAASLPSVVFAIGGLLLFRRIR